MDERFQKKIVNDLEKSGFASEMKVMQTCMTRHWSCHGGAAYLDRDQKKTREIDLNADHWLRREIAPGVFVASWFHFVCEVKRSKAPWVAFRQPLRGPFERVDAWQNLAYCPGPNKWRPLLVEAMSKHSLLVDLNWRCYSIHESFKEPTNTSRWYSAFVSASKAAHEVYRSQVQYARSAKLPLKPEFKGPIPLHFVQPAIVLDGLLIAADLNDDGNITLQEIDEAPTEFVFRSRHYRRMQYRVDLVCLKNLPKYLERCEARQLAIFEKVCQLAEEAIS